MRETSIMDNLNCKTQAHARVCEEKLEEKNDCRLKTFSLKDGPSDATQEDKKKRILLALLLKILHNIKVLILCLIITNTRDR